jgi:hypothetical protein
MNPVVNSHYRVPAAGRARSVLSRIVFSGLDYTQRPNKHAYHLVVDPTQQPLSGPACIMLQPGVMQPLWTGEPRLLPPSKSLAMNDVKLTACKAWEAAAGDAGWAGILAETFLLDPAKVAYLIYEPGFDPLPLIAEATALLPQRLRWYVTFNTHFTELPAGLFCAWRCVVADTPVAKEARRYASSGLVIDLTGLLGPAPDQPAAHSAREGKILVVPAAVTPVLAPALRTTATRSAANIQPVAGNGHGK